MVMYCGASPKAQPGYPPLILVFIRTEQAKSLCIAAESTMVAMALLQRCYSFLGELLEEQ